ncbi:MAG TPA: transcription termination/antitermination protein NusA, partial [Desulfuromonadales bacterium]|nr:transcription termination/antitermination protein NusA [Desulfuromonadales bacterium]
TRIYVDNEEEAMEIIVPDDQLSLAIGKRGQNVRLAAKLTGWKIDIKSESRAAEVALEEEALEEEQEEFSEEAEVSETENAGEAVEEVSEEHETAEEETEEVKED